MRLALSLELHRAALVHRRRLGEHAAHGIGHENLAAIGLGAETARDVHDVADDGVLETALGADVAGEALAEAQSDADLQARPSLRSPSAR